MTIADIMDDSAERMWGDRVVTRADQIEIAPMLTGDQLEKFREIDRANTAGMDPFTTSIIGGFPRVPDLNTQDNYKRQMMARCAREMRDSDEWLNPWFLDTAWLARGRVVTEQGRALGLAPGYTNETFGEIDTVQERRAA